MAHLFSPEDDTVGRIHDQLAHLEKIKSTLPPNLDNVQLLTREQISRLIQAAFWASLRSNEGRTTVFCASVAARESFNDAVVFLSPAVYDEEQIAKLAPAVPVSYTHLTLPTICSV